MALGLHPDCQARLKQLLTENLALVKVHSNGLLDILSTYDAFISTNAVLPQTGAIHDNLQKFIGEFPIITFLVETLGRELYENDKNTKKDAALLQQLPNYTNLGATAGRLVDDFESLPCSYRISLELPLRFGKQIRSVTTSFFSLTSSFKIVAADGTFKTIYPLQSGVEARDRRLFGGPTILSSLQSEQWEEETAYIQIDAKGFDGFFIKTEPILEAIEMIKSFIGLSLATGLTKKGEMRTGLFAMADKYRTSWLIVHRKLGDSWQIWSTHALPTDLSKILNKLEIEDLSGRLNAKRLSDWIQNRLQVISTAFRNQQKAKRILRAAQWLLDGYTGDNELLSFIQTTVAVEIMLGDKSISDTIGIAELLGNRCAYLIGESHSQREKILKDFKNIYEVRSNIVHSGKNRLNFDERGLFGKLQWMCRRVISKELDLIAEDKSNDNS